MNKYRNVKMRVTKENIELVQKFLFEDGCYWGTGGETIQHTDARYLFVKPEGRITFLEEEEELYFREHAFEEVFVTTTVNVNISRHKKYVEVLGQQYEKEALLAALKALESKA